MVTGSIGNAGEGSQLQAVTSREPTENECAAGSANKSDTAKSWRMKRVSNLLKFWGGIATALPSRIAIASRTKRAFNLVKRVLIKSWTGVATVRLSRTQAEKDIKSFLLCLYIGGYLLAVVPPNLIDPRLSTTAIPGPRHYDHWLILIPIGLIACGLIVGMFLRDKETSIKPLYFSILFFELSIIGSLWMVFKPFPHGTPLQVGIIVGFLSAFTIYIWSLVIKIEAQVKDMTFPLGESALDYVKVLFGFVRQGSFAGVALFGALLFGAFTTDFEYGKMISDEKHDLFLLSLNAAVQVGFYVVLAVAGPLRYLFNANLTMLALLKRNATESVAGCIQSRRTLSRQLKLARRAGRKKLIARSAGAFQHSEVGSSSPDRRAALQACEQRERRERGKCDDRQAYLDEKQ